MLRSLQRLVHGAVSSNASECYVCDGAVDLAVVGESRYQDNLRRLVGDRAEHSHRVRVDAIAILEAEPENPYDANAIAVTIDAMKVGYLSREDAVRYGPGLHALERAQGKRIGLRAAIAGGGAREDGPGSLGVFLKIDPVQFGLEAPHRDFIAKTGTRTGLSEAVASDRDDDSYDLAWMSRLPEEPGAAIPLLRGVLASERSPVARHFLYNELEEFLYRDGQHTPSSLDEYDEVCTKHDNEMDVLRPALVQKFGGVPWLDTYRQMSIRQRKAGRITEAIRWAERGLTIYGSEALRGDAVEDLRERIQRLRDEGTATEPRKRVRSAPPTTPISETLVCAQCHREFSRTRVPGRKPKLCQECNSASQES